MAKQNRFNFLQSSLEGEVLPEQEEDVTPSPTVHQLPNQSYQLVS